MKRKIIKQGNNTLTITLPRTWTDKFHIQSGDEVDLEEKGKELIIKNSNIILLEKVQIDISKMNERVLRWVMSAAHKTGYDEIEILNHSPDQLKIIYELLKDLYTGFSIVDQTPVRCVIKAISHDSDNEFDAIFRRAFLVALTMSDSVLDHLQRRDFNNMTTLIPLEHSNNQLTNFCERIINKMSLKDSKKNCFYYVIAWNLEKVCDSYKYLCDFFPNKKVKINNDILELLKKVNQFFRSYYELFYKFDINELSKLAAKGKELSKEADKLSSLVKTEGDFMLLSTASQVVLQTMDFSASYVAINMFKEE